MSQRRAYTCTQQIPPLPRGICGHPFHLRDAPIDRPPCCGMLHCQMARLHDLWGQIPTRSPMCALLFGSPTPSDANCLNPHDAPCWACLACGTLPSHITPRPVRPGGPPPHPPVRISHKRVSHRRVSHERLSDRRASHWRIPHERVSHSRLLHGRTPPACAAGRSGIDSFARVGVRGRRSQPTRPLTHDHCR